MCHRAARRAGGAANALPLAPRRPTSTAPLRLLRCAAWRLLLLKGCPGSCGGCARGLGAPCARRTAAGCSWAHSDNAGMSECRCPCRWTAETQGSVRALALACGITVALGVRLAGQSLQCYAVNISRMRAAARALYPPAPSAATMDAPQHSLSAPVRSIVHSTSQSKSCARPYASQGAHQAEVAALPRRSAPRLGCGAAGSRMGGPIKFRRSRPRVHPSAAPPPPPPLGSAVLPPAALIAPHALLPPPCAVGHVPAEAGSQVQGEVP